MGRRKTYGRIVPGNFVQQIIVAVGAKGVYVCDSDFSFVRPFSVYVEFFAAFTLYFHSLSLLVPLFPRMYSIIDIRYGIYSKKGCNGDFSAF